MGRHQSGKRLHQCIGVLMGAWAAPSLQHAHLVIDDTPLDVAYTHVEGEVLCHEILPVRLSCDFAR